MFKVGFSTRNISPSEPVWLGGYASRTEPSQGIHDPLYAKAVFISDGGADLVLVSCDLLCFTQNQIDSIKKRVLVSYGLQNIAIAATHTHSAPETRTYTEDGNHQVNLQWLAHVENMVVESVGEAMKRAEPSRLYAEQLSVPEVAKNRRVGETVTDEILTVIRAENMSREIKGYIINYPCHCTVLDSSNYLVSADYPGYIYQKLQNKSGATVLFFNGACGNINIGYSADASALGMGMGDLRTYYTAEKKADILLEKIENAFFSAKELEPRIIYKSIALKFPLKTDLPESSKLEKEIAGCVRKIDECTDDAVKTKFQLEKIYWTSLFENASAYHTDGKSFIDGEAAVIGLGNILIITFPLELFCEIGLEIKELFKNDWRTAIFGYTNGYLGYLPTKAAHAAGGYECETSVHNVNSENYLIDIMKSIEI